MSREENFEIKIGLEVHAQLNTKSKLFCSCRTDFGAEPNSQTCPVCLGLPGALPVLNEKAVAAAIKLGLALNCKIARVSNFARKNYFYPDLPKGYQITQFDNPICKNGYLEIMAANGSKKIRIVRIHLEEDAGKSIHNESYVPHGTTLIDLNRCGVPLLEIVTAPELTKPDEAAAFVSDLQQLLRYLRISDGNLEEGSLRCDANVSVRLIDELSKSIKVEIKNLNSLKNLTRALNYEIERQKSLINSKAVITATTVLWNEKTKMTQIMRDKEIASDYRYFNDPDLLPLVLDDKWMEEIQKSLPELPAQKANRFYQEYHLLKNEAALLIENPDRADLYESLVQEINDAKLACKWMLQEYIRYESQIEEQRKLEIRNVMAEILSLLKLKQLSWRKAKEVFEHVILLDKSLDEILKSENQLLICDEEYLQKTAREILSNNQDVVEKYKAGKTQLFNFFVGQIMAKTSGRADPGMVKEILINLLSES